jgi:hypothetical protein
MGMVDGGWADLMVVMRRGGGAERRGEETRRAEGQSFELVGGRGRKSGGVVVRARGRGEKGREDINKRQ